MIGLTDARHYQSFALVPFFLEFHAELQRLKRMAAQGAAPGAVAPPPDSDPEYIVRRLQTLLESQALLAGRRASASALDQVREAQYVMAALADDVFLYGLEWRGREVWRENVLELRLFGSRYAGERIFENIEEILRVQDRRQAELAPIYILALTLGFKGRFRGTPDRGAGAIKDYSRRLFQFAFERPADLRGADQVIANEAYGHVLSGQPPRRMLLRPTWPLAVAGVVIAFLVVSQVAWMAGMAGMDQATDRVIAAATPGPASPAPLAGR